MTALFSIDCHACGARNTIDRETLRRVEPIPTLTHRLGKRYPECPCAVCFASASFGRGSVDPEPAA